LEPQEGDKSGESPAGDWQLVDVDVTGSNGSDLAAIGHGHRRGRRRGGLDGGRAQQRPGDARLDHVGHVTGQRHRDDPGRHLGGRRSGLLGMRAS
jgi:hypothetical protein